MKAYAHSGKNKDRSDWQPLESHLSNVAKLAANIAEPFNLSKISYLAGAFHDFGKYNPEFDKVLTDDSKKVRVDHSTAGGRYLIDFAKDPNQKLIARLLAHVILGHHAGLPNTLDNTNSNLTKRISSHKNNTIPELNKKINLLMHCAPGDLTASAHEILSKIRSKNTAGFDLSVAGRMIFSSLVDSDYRDTELFYQNLEGRLPERTQSDLREKIQYLLDSYNQHMDKLISSGKNSEVNTHRLNTLKHIRKNAIMKPGLFTLTVPTGGGKTLASMGFALDHAKKFGHRRIIYAIPYTSIIEQTASVFCNLFGDEDVVLEHHSSIDEKGSLEAQKKLRLAMEDWARPIIVTTNVQLFESLFSVRPSKCRKIHNIANSIIILDEAQCLPRHLLMPVLAMLDVLCSHYGCSVIFCTATQPAFDSRQLRNGGLKLEGRELAPKPVEAAKRMQRARVIDAESMSDENLISELKHNRQGVVILNTREHALELYELGKENNLKGLIHLTTRQHAHDRKEILKEVNRRLKEGMDCRLIATSLIEAGVDLDFPIGWRAEAGLDSIIQAAGRVNREGRNSLEKSILKVFKPVKDQNPPPEIALDAEATWRIAGKHESLVAPEAIRDWFEEIYWQKSPEFMGKELVDKFKLGSEEPILPYRCVSNEFELIQNNMVPVIILLDSQGDNISKKLSDRSIKSYDIARQVQSFSVQVPMKVRCDLIENGHASYKSPEIRGDQFCVLENISLYTYETGLNWRELDYIGRGYNVI